MATPTKYSYVDAGFNGFMSRSIASTRAFTLSQTANDFKQMNLSGINFDNSQTSGSLGSSISIGSITINGIESQISISDRNNNVVGLIGNLGD